LLFVIDNELEMYYFPYYFPYYQDNIFYYIVASGAVIRFIDLEE